MATRCSPQQQQPFATAEAAARGPIEAPGPSRFCEPCWPQAHFAHVHCDTGNPLAMASGIIAQTTAAPSRWLSFRLCNMRDMRILSWLSAGSQFSFRPSRTPLSLTRFRQPQQESKFDFCSPPKFIGSLEIALFAFYTRFRSVPRPLTFRHTGLKNRTLSRRSTSILDWLPIRRKSLAGSRQICNFSVRSIGNCQR